MTDVVKIVGDQMAHMRDKTAAQWAEEINAAYRQTIESYLKLGHILIAAKADLDRHGEWERMIAAHLPFDTSTAQRLMKIARDERIAKAARAQLLPNAWGTMYELTKLPSPAFESAVTAGDINPHMTRAEAITLVREAVPPKEKRKKPKEPDNAAEADMVKQWANSFSVHARDNIGLIAEWTRRFGKLWKKCPKTQEMRKTARKVADEWDSILKVIDDSLADPNAKDTAPKPKTGAERTAAWRQRKKEAEGGEQIDLEECIAEKVAQEGQ
jgi:hypothetical protein